MHNNAGLIHAKITHCANHCDLQWARPAVSSPKRPALIIPEMRCDWASERFGNSKVHGTVSIIGACKVYTNVDPLGFQYHPPQANTVTWNCLAFTVITERIFDPPGPGECNQTPQSSMLKLTNS